MRGVIPPLPVLCLVKQRDNFTFYCKKQLQFQQQEKKRLDLKECDRDPNSSSEELYKV